MGHEIVSPNFDRTEIRVIGSVSDTSMMMAVIARVIASTRPWRTPEQIIPTPVLSLEVVKGLSEEKEVYMNLVSDTH